MPVRSAPRMPPTACTPKTSSESSAPRSLFSPVTPHRQIHPAARPMTNAPGMPTLPAAGVVERSPLPDQASLRIQRLDELGIGIEVGPRPEPHHVCYGHIAEREPDGDKGQYGGKLRPLCNCAEHKAAGNSGKGSLEGDI